MSRKSITTMLTSILTAIRAESAAHGRARIVGKAREHMHSLNVRRSVNRTSFSDLRPSSSVRVNSLSSIFETKPVVPTRTRAHAANCGGRGCICCGVPASVVDNCGATLPTTRCRFCSGSDSVIKTEETYQSLQTHGGAMGISILKTLRCSCRRMCASAKLRTHCTNCGGRPRGQ